MKTALTQTHDDVMPAPRAAWFWLGTTALTLVLAGLFTFRPPCPDVATFDYVGWRMNHGDTLYVDVIEQNFPAIMWLHALSSALFGNHLWSFRLLDFALMLIGCVGVYRLAVVGGSPITRYLVVPLYQLYYAASDLWMTGQRDIVASHIMVLLGALHVARMRGGPAYLPVVVGAGMAFVSLVRPTCVLFLPLLIGVELLARRKERPLAQIVRDVLIAGISYAGLLAVIAIATMPSGALRGWYEAAVVFNAMLYSQTASTLDFLRALWWLVPVYWWFLVLALGGAVAWFRRGERDAFYVALALAITGLVSTFVQGKGFGYHLAPMYVTLVLFSAEALGATWAAVSHRSTPRTRLLFAAACLLALYGNGRRMGSQYRTAGLYVFGLIDRERLQAAGDPGLRISLSDVVHAAEYARAHTTPEQTILPWNRAILINYLAERRLPTPLATVGMLDLLRDSFPRARAWLTTFERTLREDPPALVFTYNQQEREDYDRLWTPNPELPVTALVREALQTRYRRVARFGALDAYALK